MLPESYQLLAAVHPAIGMVGRAAELKQLHDCLERALRGERQVLFLSGEPGIGKTTLTDAFLTQVQMNTGQEVWVTRGQCVEQYGAGEAYLPVLEALSRLGRQSAREEVVATLAQYAPTWLAQLPALVNMAEREGLQRVLLGATRERMLRELAEAVEALTARRPLLIVLEDLHWSDVSTVELVAYLARRQGTARLLLIGTYRPAEVMASNHPLRGAVQELCAHKRAGELQLPLLQENEVAAYVHGRFQLTHLPGELTDVVYRWTGGNPLFMVNVVEHLLHEGVIAKEGGQWRVKQAAAASHVDVPENLRQLVEKQFEGLGAEEQRVLEAGSVVGAEFAVAAVAAALEQDLVMVEERCESLAAKGQFVRAAGIEEWPDGSLGGRYSFIHALYQNVVYDRIAAARRIQLHRRIGGRKAAAYGQRAREIASELAAHFLAGRDTRRAVQYLEYAGENAIRRHAHQEAIGHLTKGLELLRTVPDSPERMRHELTLQVTLATPLMATKGYAAPEVEQAYARAHVLCQQVEASPQLFPVLRGLVSFYHVRSALRAGREVSEQLLNLAERVDDPLLHVQAHYGHGAMLFDLADLPTALSHLEQALALYNREQHPIHVSLYGGYDPGVACLHWSAMTLWLLGYPDQAQQRSNEALRLAQELAHPFSLAWAWHIAAAVHRYRGEERAALGCVNTALALAQEHGFAFISAMAMIAQGWGLVGQGQNEAGIARIREGLSAYQATGAALTLPGYLAMLAAAHAKVGQGAEALCLVNEAFDVIDKTAEHLHEVDLYRLKAGLLLQSQATPRQVEDPHPASRIPHAGAEGEAEAYLLKALEIARRQQAKSLELRAAMSLGRLWQKQGKTEEARQLLEEIYGWFTEGFHTRDLQDAEKLLAALGSTVERRTKEEVREPAVAVRIAFPTISTSPVPRFERQGEWQHAEGGGREQRTLLSEAENIPRPPLPGRGDETAAPAKEPQTQLPTDPPLLSDQIFRREGEYWTLAFGGSVCRLKDARGLQYLAQLLRHPHQEFHAIALVSGSPDPLAAVPSRSAPIEQSLGIEESEEPVVAGFTDTGEMLDPQARAAYRQRLKELQTELEEAQEFNDFGRVERLQEEIDFLTHELSSAVGLGGRARKSGSAAERARVNATRAIKAAIKKIAESHPLLGQHLAVAVKTGTFCSYSPDSRLQVTWQT